MPRIGSTTSLDKFQQDFQKIGDKSHARIVRKNGQEFLTKGAGKGKLGRWWFGVRAGARAGAIRQMRNKSVVHALANAADKAFGSLGVRLVGDFLRKNKLEMTDTLTQKNVRDAVSFVKKNIGKAQDQELKKVVKQRRKMKDRANKQAVQRLVRQKLGQAGIRNIDRKVFSSLWKNAEARKIIEYVHAVGVDNIQSDLEHLYGKIAVDELTRFLGSNATLAQKQTAFRAFVSTYTSVDSQRSSLNLQNEDIGMDRRNKLIALAKKENPSVREMDELIKDLGVKLGSNSPSRHIAGNLRKAWNNKLATVRAEPKTNDIDGLISKTRKRLNFVSGDRRGLGKAVDHALKNTLQKVADWGNMVYADRTVKNAMREIRKNPLLNSALEPYLKTVGSKAGWHHHASNELRTILRVFPKGGRGAPAALKLFHAKFLGPNAKTRLEIPNNLKTRLETAMGGNSVSRNDMKRLVADLRKALNSKSDELLVAELKTDKGKKDMVETLKALSTGRKHFDKHANAFKTNVKILKLLSNTPVVQSRVKDLTAADLTEISKVYTPNTELQAINTAKGRLGI